LKQISLSRAGREEKEEKMKIDLDLSEIFEGEDGENVNISIKEAVISAVSDRIYKSIQRSIQEKVDRILEMALRAK